MRLFVHSRLIPKRATRSRKPQALAVRLLDRLAAGIPNLRTPDPETVKILRRHLGRKTGPKKKKGTAEGE